MTNKKEKKMSGVNSYVLFNWITRFHSYGTSLFCRKSTISSEKILMSTCKGKFNHFSQQKVNLFIQLKYIKRGTCVSRLLKNLKSF